MADCPDYDPTDYKIIRRIRNTTASSMETGFYRGADTIVAGHDVPREIALSSLLIGTAAAIGNTLRQLERQYPGVSEAVLEQCLHSIKRRTRQ